jgi:geranylgeranyl pyrophosphate synthase
MLAAYSAGALFDTQDAKTKIVEASKRLFNTSGTMETVVNSLVQFLDIVVVLTSDSRYKEEITHHVEVAKDLIENTSLFNDKARQYLALAYRMVTNGQKYQKPEELDEFVTPSEAQEKAMNHAKNLVERTLSELESGHKEIAAKLLLELVLLVVIPISG